MQLASPVGGGMKNRIYVSLGVFLILGACQQSISFVDHPRPNLSVNFEPFEDADCPSSEYGLRYCDEGSTLWNLGCDEIQVTSDLLGGLDPAYPMATCFFEPMSRPEDSGASVSETLEEGNYFYVDGGFFPRFVRYVIYDEGAFTLINNEKELQEIFQPIDSPEEALSFALASTDTMASYNFDFDSENEYEVNELEDSHVEATSDGYLVYLYHYQFYGCGPHNTSLVVYHVSKDGELQQESSTPVFRDPEEDGLCVD
jgi:hypothetical protein